jgi:hypothetical protein
VPRHPPCALKNLRNKDARVHCAVLNIRPATQMSIDRQPTPTHTPPPRHRGRTCTQHARSGHHLGPTTTPRTGHPTPTRGRTASRRSSGLKKPATTPPTTSRESCGRALRTQQRAKPTRHQDRRSTPATCHQVPVVLAMPHATREPTNRCSTLSNPHGTLVRARALPATHHHPPTGEQQMRARCSLERR